MLLNAREILAEKKEENLILLAIEDITERREAEAIIKQTHERFRQLVRDYRHRFFYRRYRTYNFLQ